MSITKDSLESKFNAKNEELANAQKILQELKEKTLEAEAFINQTIGELNAFRELFSDLEQEELQTQESQAFVVNEGKPPIDIQEQPVTKKSAAKKR